MHYERVRIASLGFATPEEMRSSDELEADLAPLYDRLRLPAGRLELITGIRTRGLWRPGTLPGDMSIRTAAAALDAADWDRSTIGALVHGSVCRDHLEPATACRVHHGLELGEDCLVYDLSNACLGLLNGMVQVADLIELGKISAGLVVGSEGSRDLVETTIRQLNADHSLTRNDVKLAIASLTIGSASAAVLLADRDLAPEGAELHTALARTYTQHHDLCCSGADESASGGMQPLMQTDSERLLHAGVEAGGDAFDAFLAAASWERGDVDRTVCHQVGSMHRKAMLERLGLDAERDYATLSQLGNTGSAALPSALAMAAAEDFVGAGHRTALLGIGSGVNVLMIGANWGRVPVGRAFEEDAPPRRACSAEPIESATT